MKTTLALVATVLSFAFVAGCQPAATPAPADTPEPNVGAKKTNTGAVPDLRLDGK